MESGESTANRGNRRNAQLCLFPDSPFIPPILQAQAFTVGIPAQGYLLTKDSYRTRALDCPSIASPDVPSYRSGMSILHDSSYRASIKQRIQSLRPDSQRQWGKMSVDQMLRHVNEGLEMSLGRKTVAPMKAPLPRGLMRALVLSLPWPKGAPTMPELVIVDAQDFAKEQSRCLALIDEFTSKPVEGQWPVHPGFGRMTGRHWSKLGARHLDHHLKQFSA